MLDKTRTALDIKGELLRRPRQLRRVDNLKHRLEEAIGDNTVDNLVADLSRATEVEVGKFVGALLNVSTDNFLFAYAVPQFEGFATTFKNVTQRYQMMDGTEQGDLFAKIEIMFKNIFVDKYASMGPDVAELIAKKYAVQMIEQLKRQSIQANVDMHQDKSGTTI